MIGDDAFCPQTGAKLSDETHYDENSQQRIALADAFGIEGEEEGKLTTGAIRSSKAALFNHFRRCHQRHTSENNKLYRKTALALSRLKRAATGAQYEDLYIWYALQHRLSILDYAVDWMHTHASLRCPHCHSRLKYSQLDTGTVAGYCISDCTGTTKDQLPHLRTTIADLYTSAFDETVTTDQILQFKQ
ncbi:hypothetical protein DMJ13_27065 [halophilic archaeon]|nr:hypothetical protein DMJ13_27065 [halophilic archaeon]